MGRSKDAEGTEIVVTLYKKDPATGAVKINRRPVWLGGAEDVPPQAQIRLAPARRADKTALNAMKPPTFCGEIFTGRIRDAFLQASARENLRTYGKASDFAAVRARIYYDPKTHLLLVGIPPKGKEGGRVGDDASWVGTHLWAVDGHDLNDPLANGMAITAGAEGVSALNRYLRDAAAVNTTVTKKNTKNNTKKRAKGEEEGPARRRKKKKKKKAAEEEEEEEIVHTNKRGYIVDDFIAPDSDEDESTYRAVPADLLEFSESDESDDEEAKAMKPDQAEMDAEEGPGKEVQQAYRDMFKGIETFMEIVGAKYGLYLEDEEEGDDEGSVGSAAPNTDAYDADSEEDADSDDSMFAFSQTARLSHKKAKKKIVKKKRRRKRSDDLSRFRKTLAELDDEEDIDVTLEKILGSSPGIARKEGGVKSSPQSSLETIVVDSSDDDEGGDDEADVFGSSSVDEETAQPDSRVIESESDEDEGEEEDDKNPAKTKHARPTLLAQAQQILATPPVPLEMAAFPPTPTPPQTPTPPKTPTPTPTPAPEQPCEAESQI